MKKVLLCCGISLLLMSCAQLNKNNKMATQELEQSNQEQIVEKKIDKTLPTIGILIFEGVIMNEVIAPLDVFSNPSKDHQALFNVITIAVEDKTYSSAHGLKIKPDYTIENIPLLKVLVVPSSYNPKDQTMDEQLVNFVKEQHRTTDYIASHCAGAFLIGETGIADGKNIVTYHGGGTELQSEYPNLKVADDNIIEVVQDGKFISSNGSLVSYIASFDLLEKLTTKEHRKYVESYILFDRLKE